MISALVIELNSLCAFPHKACHKKKVLSILQLFDHLRLESPEQLDKIHGINGDLLEPQMGMSSEDIQFLAERVSIVFHSAATVRFDEALRCVRQKMNMNTKKKKNK